MPEILRPSLERLRVELQVVANLHQRVQNSCRLKYGKPARAHASRNTSRAQFALTRFAIDAGAAEFSISVDVNLVFGNNGSSWPNPFSSRRSAIQSTTIFRIVTDREDVVVNVFDRLVEPPGVLLNTAALSIDVFQTE